MITTGPGAKHADSTGDEKLAPVRPAGLLHQSFLEKWNNDKSAAESEAAVLSFQEASIDCYFRRSATTGSRLARRSAKVAS